MSSGNPLLNRLTASRASFSFRPNGQQTTLRTYRASLVRQLQTVTVVMQPNTGRALTADAFIVKHGTVHKVGCCTSGAAQLRCYDVRALFLVFGIS